MNRFKMIGIKSATGLTAIIQEGNTVSKKKVEELTKAMNDARSITPKNTDNSTSVKQNKSSYNQPQMTAEILVAIITSVRGDRAMNALSKWRDIEETT